MSTAHLEALDGGRFRISGVLDAMTVVSLLKESEKAFHGLAHVDVDLAPVTESDSSGLALLIEWLRLAKIAGRDIHFQNMPAQIEALARISEVEDLLANNRVNHDAASQEAAAQS